MKRRELRELFAAPEACGQERITVCGWVRTLRAGKAISFIEINDGSCFKNLQVVAEKDKVANYDEILRQNVGAALVVTGSLLLTPGAKQPFELHARQIAVEGASAPDYPLQKKRHTLEYLRTIQHLRPRANIFGALFRVRSQAAFAIHQFFHERGFLYIHTPVITASDCEGAGEMFQVTALNPKSFPEAQRDQAAASRECERKDDLDKVPFGKACSGKDGVGKVPLGEAGSGKGGLGKEFFGKPAYLTVSGQLNAECMALAFSKVYTFGPTFRAENSNTARHAAEFWMLEPEFAFADLADDMELAEDMIRYVLSYILRNCPEEIQFFNQFVDNTLLERLEHIVRAEFARLTYTEAVAILEKQRQRFVYPVSWGADLQTEHERYLTETVFGKPVFVTDYPKEIKAFYMRLNDDGRTVAAMDLLVPGVGEIIGGSQREERLELLKERMRELGLPEENYWWYLDLRRFGGARHAGFGLGFERLIMYITGMANIRDVLPFPRTAGSAEF
jgi:asparaginyl-tRNA synthetase